MLKQKDIAGSGSDLVLMPEEWEAYEALPDRLENQGSVLKGPTPKEAQWFAQLEAQLDHYPGNPDKIMPTRLGNRLRRAETQPLIKYGLNGNSCCGLK